jgi:hypothetical protein
MMSRIQLFGNPEQLGAANRKIGNSDFMQKQINLPILLTSTKWFLE